MEKQRPESAALVVKSEAEWREQLSAEEYRVLRESGTEPAYQGIYTDTTTPGTYFCKACGAELFRSTEKFSAACGWPSFFAPASESALMYLNDNSIPSMERTEVRCAKCNSHLGHVFSGEGYETPTDLRYCINSISLDLVPSQDEGITDPGSDSIENLPADPLLD